MDVYIFRHGMTYFSKNNIAYGDQVETAEILPEAIPVIKKLGESLIEIPTDMNFTSPFKRCIQTSNIVSEITGKTFEKDDSLRDWDPRKESEQDMMDRILEFCHMIEELNINSVAICTHGYPINALIAYFTNGKIEIEDLYNFPNPGVLVTIKDKKATYKDFNN